MKNVCKMFRKQLALWELGREAWSFPWKRRQPTLAPLVLRCVRTAKFTLYPLHRNVALGSKDPWSKRLELTHHKQACLVSDDFLSLERAQRWPTCHRAIPHRLSHPPTQQSSIRPVARAIDTHVRSDLKSSYSSKNQSRADHRTAERKSRCCMLKHQKASSWLVV